jgi:hypothetical protein
VRNGDQHLVVTKENIILWDGQNIDFVGDAIKNQFFSELNWKSRATLWAAYSPLSDEVLIGIPTGTTQRPDKLWIYNLRYGSWWPCAMDWNYIHAVMNVWDTPKLLGGHRNVNKVYEVFSGFGDGSGGTAITSSLQGKLFDFGAPPYHKGVKQVSVLMGVATGTTTTVTLQQAGSETPIGLVTFSTANQNVVAYTGGTKEPKADLKISEKYWTYRLTHSAASETVQVHRLVPYVRQRDSKRKDRT